MPTLASQTVLRRPDGGEELTGFAPLLAELDPADLGRIGDSICGVFADTLVIGYVNAAWLEFGRRNGARRPWGPGSRLLDAISGPSRAFYAAKLALVLDGAPSWEHDYECSSAEVHREFRLRMLRLAGGRAILITHSLRVERPSSAAEEPFVRTLYEDANGLIAQCGHCRRVRAVAPPRGWHWVPELVTQSRENVTHGVCETCLAYHYGPGAL